MRPFRFFFFLALGIMLFFFVARFVLVALFAAAVMSVIFFLGRKVKNFFQRMDWEDDYRYHGPFRSMSRQQRLEQAVWKDDLLVDFPSKESTYLPNYRRIEVR